MRRIVSETGAFPDTSSPKLRAISLILAGLSGIPPASMALSKALAWRSWGSLRGLNNSLSQSGSLGIAVASSMSEPAS